MTADEAEKLSVLLLRTSNDLVQSIGYVRDHDCEAAFLEYRKSTGKVMGEIYLGLLEPLWKRFPDLRPEQDGGPYKVQPEIYKPDFYLTSEQQQNVNQEP